MTDDGAGVTGVDVPVNLADLVCRAAVRAGRRTALVAGDDRPTWTELDASVEALAAGLARDLDRGDRVGIACGTGIPFAVTWWATLRAGLVAVPLNPSYTAHELAHQVGDSGCRLVVCDRVEPGAFDAAERVVPVGGDAWERLPDRDTAPPVDAAGGEDLAALVYTSGTSGRPRGAMLLAVPLCHIYGLNTGLDLAAAHAATGVLPRRFDPVEALAVVEREQVTVVVGAPPMYVTWSMLPDAVASFASVRIATSGAAPLPPEVLGRMHRTTGLTVYEGYGLTEAAPVLTLTPPAATAKPGSVGRPLSGVELRLVVAVVGAPHPYTGETVTALVVARPGTSPGQAELVAHAARSLARFTLPTAVTLVDELPRSASGSVRRSRLRGAP